MIQINNLRTFQGPDLGYRGKKIEKLYDLQGREEDTHFAEGDRPQWHRDQFKNRWIAIERPTENLWNSMDGSTASSFYDEEVEVTVVSSLDGTFEFPGVNVPGEFTRCEPSFWMRVTGSSDSTMQMSNSTGKGEWVLDVDQLESGQWVKFDRHTPEVEILDEFNSDENGDMGIYVQFEGNCEFEMYQPQLEMGEYPTLYTDARREGISPRLANYVRHEGTLGLTVNYIRDREENLYIFKSESSHLYVDNDNTLYLKLFGDERMISLDFYEAALGVSNLSGRVNQRVTTTFLLSYSTDGYVNLWTQNEDGLDLLISEQFQFDSPAVEDVYLGSDGEDTKGSMFFSRIYVDDDYRNRHEITELLELEFVSRRTGRGYEVTDSRGKRPNAHIDFSQHIFNHRLMIERLSKGVIMNSNGLYEEVPADTPRFDFHPMTGELRGIIVEERRENVVVFSNEVNPADHTEWETDNLEFTEADSLFKDRTAYRTTGQGYLAQDLGIFTGKYETVSLILESMNNAPLTVEMDGIFNIDYDFENDEIFNVDEDYVARVYSEQLGEEGPNGGRIVRLEMTVNSKEIAADDRRMIVRNYVSGSDLIFHHVQYEQGTFASSPIVTDDSPNAREADVVKYPGDIFNPDGGTFIVTAERRPTTPTAEGDFIIFARENDNVGYSLSFREDVEVAFRTSNGIFEEYKNAQDLTTNFGGSITAAASYDKVGNILSVNGSDVTSQKTSPIDDINNIIFGHGTDGVKRVFSSEFTHEFAGNPFFVEQQFLNGWLKQFTYFPRRFPADMVETFSKGDK